ncbi:LOB domain-containing protein 1-like [Hibiscus syriacus]|uniref:LOB domain-containing protein 1-like n=1 Tax=Hibiscus syriacus TaxID=106335 RepID=UPI00192493AA|nr:LOB domain-containing protein 1-like [Hibiscus syriacus]
MENNEKCAQFSSSLSQSPSSSPLPCFPSLNSQSPPPTVVLSPCAACKILRRRCVEKCVLAPYFPPTEPYKFTIAHRVFGASNIIKSLQELPELQRTDAINSMVYEASARIRDPVYGCAGAVCQLQKQVSELQGQLAKAQAEIVTMQWQQANLVAIILEMTQTNSGSQQIDTACFLDDNNLASAWEPLWT